MRKVPDIMVMHDEMNDCEVWYWVHSKQQIWWGLPGAMYHKCQTNINCLVLLSLFFAKITAIISSICFCAGGEHTRYDDADLPLMERQTGCIILPKPAGVLACMRLEK